MAARASQAFFQRFTPRGFSDRGSKPSSYRLDDKQALWLVSPLGRLRLRRKPQHEERGMQLDRLKVSIVRLGLVAMVSGAADLLAQAADLTKRAPCDQAA